MMRFSVGLANIPGPPVFPSISPVTELAFHSCLWDTCIKQTVRTKEGICLFDSFSAKKGRSNGVFAARQRLWTRSCIHFNHRGCCSADTSRGARLQACRSLPMLATTQKVCCLVSNFLCLLYIFCIKDLTVSLDHLGRGNQIWTRRQKKPTKPVCQMCVCAENREGLHTVKCWHLLQDLAGLECDTLLYTKALGPCRRHKKTSICPPPNLSNLHIWNNCNSVSSFHLIFPAISSD